MTTPPATAKRTLRLPQDLAAINRRLEKASPQQILAWSVASFGDGLCMQSSMQKRSSTLAHMLWSGGHTEVPIVFVDTGYHFGATLETRDELSRRYQLPVITVYPTETPEHQHERFGRELFRGADDYKTCCELRKIQPWVEAARPFGAVISGLTRAEGGARTSIDIVSWDPRIDAWIVHPLANWSFERIDAYNAANDVYVNPLHSLGYPSIGCETCTTKVQPGEDQRAGRWRHIRESLEADQREAELYCNINWADRKQPQAA